MLITLFYNLRKLTHNKGNGGKSAGIVHSKFWISIRQVLNDELNTQISNHIDERVVLLTGSKVQGSASVLLYKYYICGD